MELRKTAGELSHKALCDTTKYDARDIALQFSDDMDKLAYDCIKNHLKVMEDTVDQDLFCLVYVLAGDPLIKNLIRRKFYMWPYLPSPRPNQGVFLYNKRLEKLTKRLWVLPNALTMAELATSDLVVDKRYQTMRDWCVAFFKGTFWEFIRYQHSIDMISQEEYFNLYRNEFAQLGVNDTNANLSQSFDFGKVQGFNMVHSE